MEYRTLTTAIISALATATGRPVGDARAPDDATRPYLVVRQITDTNLPEMRDDPGSATAVYQVTAVADRRDQRDWLGDKARLAFETVTLASADAKVIGRRLVATVTDEDERLTSWNLHLRYEFLVGAP